jgi:branched-chain amino acid aminotransferase
MSVVMLNGAFVDAEQATISALDRALTHGLGLYETIKLSDGIPIFFDEHSARLEHGFVQVGIEAPCDRRELADQIVRLSAASGVASGACRVLVTAGAPGGKPALLIQTEVRPVPTQPLALITSRTLRAAAALKSNSFIASHIAQRAARAVGADDAVFVDEEGRLYEATTANVFIVRNGSLSTAPTNGAILPGVIRAKVMELASAAGIPTSEHHTLVSDLGDDDALLLTSSVRGIVAAGSIDGRRLRQDDEFLARLRSLLSNAERASTTAFTATYH